MIKSKADYQYYLEADRIVLGRKKEKRFNKAYFRAWLRPDLIWKFEKTLIKVEYLMNCRGGFLAKIEKLYINWRFRRLSYLLNFTIPPNTFGPGLSIAHYGTIVINGAARIGANCRLHTCVNIGTAAGYRDKAPQIGNNVYIGAGAKIYGNISIADNVVIAPNSVVNKSFKKGNIIIAGIPAKKLWGVDIEQVIINATDIIARGLNKRDLSGFPAKKFKEIIENEEQSRS